MNETMPKRYKLIPFRECGRNITYDDRFENIADATANTVQIFFLDYVATAIPMISDIGEIDEHLLVHPSEMSNCCKTVLSLIDNMSRRPISVYNYINLMEAIQFIKRVLELSEKGNYVVLVGL